MSLVGCYCCCLASLTACTYHDRQTDVLPREVRRLLLDILEHPDAKRVGARIREATDVLDYFGIESTKT